MRFPSARHAYGCCQPCTCGVSQGYGAVRPDLRPVTGLALMVGVIGLVAAMRRKP